LIGKDGLQVGYVLVELATTYYYAKKYEKGIPLLDRLEPMLGQYQTGQVRAFMKQTYRTYAGELARRGMPEKAQHFETIAASL
jgi:hypothetical protein